MNTKGTLHYFFNTTNVGTANQDFTIYTDTESNNWKSLPDIYIAKNPNS